MTITLAHSGAHITILEHAVVKETSRAEEQSTYLKYLPPDRSPKVLYDREDFRTLSAGFYVMERLQEMDKHPQLILREALDVLASEFWCHKQLVETNECWREELEEWARTRHFNWLCSGLVYALYPEEADEPWCMIHGDPTVANCMQRDGQLVFIDPLEPGDKIPSVWEVDMGKLLQSALGWEYLLDQTVPLPWAGMASELLLYCTTQPNPKLAFNRCWFWCAVHCMRLVPYAANERVRQWGFQRSLEAAGAVRL